MIVGPKDAGKTSLVDTLLDEQFRDTKADVQGKDLESDISNCTIHYTNILPNDVNWKPLDVPLYQTLTEYLESKFADVTLPNVGEGDEGAGGTFLADPPEATLKILDMSAEFGFYKTHQMFLASAMAFLLFVDVTKPLDECLPESAAMKEQEGKLEIPRMTRELLDFLLNIISSFVGTGNGTKSVIIVLTHSDDLDPQTRDVHVKKYKKEIREHLKGQHVCKLVEKTIVVLSNKVRDPETLKNLRNLIVELCKAKPMYEEEIPCTWLKCEADILGDSDTFEQRYLTIRDLRDKFVSCIGMSAEQVTEFLKFHSKHGSMMHSTLHELDALVVTDAQFLVDAFTLIIEMWKSRKTSQLSLHTENELENDLDEGILSTRSLNIIWDQMEFSGVDRLAEIMVHFYQFIQWDQRMENQEISRKFIIPALLPPASNFERHLMKREGTKTLVYFFHQSQDVKSSGLLPVGLLSQLVVSLLADRPNRRIWKKEDMFCNGASFRTGTRGDILMMISGQGCFIKLKALVEPDPECDDIYDEISKARQEFEQELMLLIECYHHNHGTLHCSVCVSRCHKSSDINKSNYSCLHILGAIGKVGKKPLWSGRCKIHKEKHLPSKAFEFWFYHELNLMNCPGTSLQDDQKLLKRVAKSIVDLQTLTDVGIELGMDMKDIRRTVQDSYNNIYIAVLNMMMNWHDKSTMGGSLQRGTPKYNKLKQVLNEVGMNNLLP